MSQIEAAQVLGVSQQRYHDAEANRLPERDIRTMLADLNTGECVAPTMSDLCALARRRSGWTLTEAQHKFRGLSRVTFLERERAGTDDMVVMWQRYGFSFDGV